MSKNKCLQELNLGAQVKKRDLEMMKKSECLENGSTTYHNLKTSRNEDFSLKALSTGGLTFSEPAINYIRSVTTKSRPDLWQESIQDTQSEDSAQEKKSATKGRLTDLTDSEKSIVHLLDNEIIRSLQDEIGELSTNEENTLQTAENETNYEKKLLQLALKHSDAHLLNDLISDLKEVNELKWRELQPEELYPHILTDPFNIMKKMTVQEILTVGKTLEQRTDRKFCKTNASKAVNANLIAEAFLGQDFIQIPSKKERKCKNVRSLQELSKNVILCDNYKLLPLQVSLANALHREKRKAWFDKSPIHMWGYIPHVWEEHTVLKYFSYPEYLEERQQIEHWTLDYTHILTNMKSLILNKGFDFCPKEHFQQLSRENPDLLSCPLVFDNIDQQNTYSAKLMFSKKSREVYGFKRLCRNSGIYKTC